MKYMNKNNITGGQVMSNVTISKGLISVLLVLLASLAWVTNASANPKIMAAAKAKGVNATGCLSCHTSNAGSRANLKPNFFAAYKLDKVNFSRLKTLINGCPSKKYSKTTFICEKRIIQSGSLGKATLSAAATDIYAVNCAAGTKYLSFSVRDVAPVKPPLISIQVTKGAVASALSTDSRDGDLKYSPELRLNGNAGVYTMKISKSASSVKGAELYIALFSCRNAIGDQTGTTWKRTQNQ
jgi:hypothetical protein